MPIVDLLVTSSLLSSKGEARRMIQQNAVSIVDGEKVTVLTSLLVQVIKVKLLRLVKESF